jgi:hypothetical protein
MKNEAFLLNENINDGFRRPDYAIVFNGGAKVINTCDSLCLYSAFWMGSHEEIHDFYEKLIVSVEKEVQTVNKDQEFNEDTVCVLWQGTQVSMVAVITSRNELNGLNDLLVRSANKDITQLASFDTENTPWHIWDKVCDIRPEWKSEIANVFSPAELAKVMDYDPDSVKEVLSA